jgi:hypothetical protein
LILLVLLFENLSEDLIDLLIVFVQLQSPKSIADTHPQGKAANREPKGTFSGWQHRDSEHQCRDGACADDHGGTLSRLFFILKRFLVEGGDIIQIHVVDIAVDKFLLEVRIPVLFLQER